MAFNQLRRKFEGSDANHQTRNFVSKFCLNVRKYNYKIIYFFIFQKQNLDDMVNSVNPGPQPQPTANNISTKIRKQR
jgi:hypothetical protein